MRPRPLADEVFKKWWSLTLPQREDVMSFHDQALIKCITEALHVIQENHNAAVAIGIQRCADDFDPLKSTPLLAAFFFKCLGQTCADDPSVAAISPSTFSLRVKSEIVQSGELFDQCKTVLPDFLCPKNKRVPLPVPYWKQLWDGAPSSVSCLEKQFAKTIEQAMWLMASDSQLESLIEQKEAPPVASTDELDESWMDEDISSSKGKKAQSKTNKRKRKHNKQVAPLEETCGAKPTPDDEAMRSEAADPSDADQKEWQGVPEQYLSTPMPPETTSASDDSESATRCTSDSELVSVCDHGVDEDTETDVAHDSSPEFSHTGVEGSAHHDLEAVSASLITCFHAIEPPPGLEYLRKHDATYTHGDLPMKVEPSFAAPMRPQKLHCLLPDLNTLPMGDEKMTLQNNAPCVLDPNFQSFLLPWFAQSQGLQAHPDVISLQRLQDLVLHPALGA
jgi:hypothetical protein